MAKTKKGKRIIAFLSMLSIIIWTIGASLVGTFAPEAQASVAADFTRNANDSYNVNAGSTNVVVLDVTLPAAGSDTTIAGTAPSAGTTITTTKDTDWTTLYFYDAAAGADWNATNDIIFVDDGNIYYDDTKDTNLAGTTTENSAGVLTEPGDWTLFFYDGTDANAWTTAQDWIGQDGDSDGVYTSAADTTVDCDGSGSTGAGTCEVAAGNALMATEAADNLCTDSLTTPTCVYIDTGGVCGDLTADTELLGATGCDALGDTLVGAQWAFYDNGLTPDAYDDGEDLFIENVSGELTYSAAADTTIAGTAPSAGTTITTTKDTDWTTLYFYDAAAGADWNATNDIIFVDDGNIYYDDTKDTNLAGTTTENSAGVLTEPGDWTLFFYDGTDANAWTTAQDWIGQDGDSSGTFGGDQLVSLKVHNGGSATDNDITNIKVWEDGSTAGWSGDETLIGADLSSAFWDQVVICNDTSNSTSASSVYSTGSAAQRIFVTVDVASGASDGAGLYAQLVYNAVAANAPVQLASSGDGPTDATISGLSRNILVSSSPVAQTPSAPRVDKAEAQSENTIRWYFYDQANNESGFRIKDNAGNVVTSDGENAVYLNETGLLANTKYSGRKVYAYNSYGESGASEEFPAVYTLASDPGEVFASSTSLNSITVGASGISNISSGSSGLYFENVTTGENSGWVQENSWTVENLSAGTGYEFKVKARNGDGIETGWSAAVVLTTLSEEGATTEEGTQEGTGTEKGTSPEEAAKPISVKDGDLIRAAGDYKVYIVKGNYKRWIQSSEIFSFYSHLGFSAVKEVSKSEMENYTDAWLVRADGDTKVYEVNGDGTKHWLNMTAEEFMASGRRWNMVYVVNSQERDFYSTGADVLK